MNSHEHGEKELVAYSALLHDIGKFFQRAELPHDDQYAQLSQEDFGYSGAHAKWSASFAKTIGMPEIVSDILLHHHNAKGASVRKLCDIVIEADHLASAERIKSEQADDVKREPLQSIFSQLSLEKGGSAPYFYTVSELEPSNLQMPIPHKKDTMDGWKLTPEYKRLWKNFEKDCAGSKDALTVDNLLLLLERYTTYMPAAAYVSRPDISLYDHLKITCAIAVASYNYEKEVQKARKDKWLLLGGSLSGIQRHIYNLKTSKHTLKILRGRSFSLELVTECTINRLLGELGLFRANIIYSGGGNFFILCQNTPQALDVVDKIRKETNQELFRRYGPTLYMVMDKLALTENEFKDFSPVWEKVQKALGGQKGKKYLEEINADKKSVLGPFDDSPDEEKCAFCGGGKPVDTADDMPICDDCRFMLETGRSLVRATGLVLSPQVGRESFFGFAVSFTDDTDAAHSKTDDIVYGFNRYPRLSPASTHVMHPFGKYYASTGHDLKTTDVLAEEAVGANRIATVRMDVDRLGSIFTKALAPASLSRMATLSRFLKYFFGSQLNELARGGDGGDKKGLNVAIVYSGGDDVFFIGSWNDAISYMYHIYETFRTFTCGNVTISAGMVLNKDKYPIGKSAHDAAMAEHRAKDNGRDSVSMFGTTHTWAEAIRLRETYLDRMLALGSYDKEANAYTCALSQGTLYRLNELAQRSRGRNHLVLTPLVYLAARQKEQARRRSDRPDAAQGIEQFFETVLSNPQDIPHLRLPLIWMMSYMREGKR
ncbi:MAG: type III-A CRISPR-associated protein Cas10/Csm1 [Candidatus Methanofastidiosa archaeon]|nr:type III-A CRISPR-associated protein Cas10/Csm1 [Candidatus Methanofastidiosa archaeon]